MEQLVARQAHNLEVACSSPAPATKSSERSSPRTSFFEQSLLCRNGGMVDTRDLKSLGHCARAGSSPAFGTNLFLLIPLVNDYLQEVFLFLILFRVTFAFTYDTSFKKVRLCLEC